MTIANKREQIWQSLSDPGYRHQFAEEEVNVGIAFQIRSLRNRQKLTQAELAELLGDKKKQPLLSAWENPNYGKYTLGTLRDLAKAFDVGLLVRFVPFSTLVDWTINLTSDVIGPPSFSEEQNHALTSLSTVRDSVEGAITIDANTLLYPNFRVGMPVLTTYSSAAMTKKEEETLVTA